MGMSKQGLCWPLQTTLYASFALVLYGLFSVPGAADNYNKPKTQTQKITSPLDIGWSCRTSDRSDRTIRLCSQIIRTPDTAPKKLLFALNKRARAWIVEDELRIAIADFSQIAKLSATPNDAIFERAKLYLRLDDFENAKNDYSTLIARNTKLVTSYCRRGLAKLKLKQHQSAIEDYNAGLKIDPTRLDCVVGRGDVFAELGQHERALAEYATAIETNERYWDAYFRRSELHKKRGDKHLAIADYSRILQLDFLNLRAAKALRALGVIHPYP